MVLMKDLCMLTWFDDDTQHYNVFPKTDWYADRTYGCRNGQSGVGIGQELVRNKSQTGESWPLRCEEMNQTRG